MKTSAGLACVKRATGCRPTLKKKRKFSQPSSLSSDASLAQQFGTLNLRTISERLLTFTLIEYKTDV